MQNKVTHPINMEKPMIKKLARAHKYGNVIIGGMRKEIIPHKRYRTTL